MRKIPVKLTDLELWALWELAQRRNANKENHNVKTRKVDENTSDVEMHYIGMKAEYAVAKLVGAEFNPENTLVGDPGYDFEYRGIKVDVKLSQLDVKFRPGTFVADAVILVQPLSSGTHTYCGRKVKAEKDKRVSNRKFAFKNVLVVGWVSKERFEKEREIRNFGYNDVEFMKASDLNSMSELKKYAQGKAPV